MPREDCAALEQLEREGAGPRARAVVWECTVKTRHAGQDLLCNALVLGLLGRPLRGSPTLPPWILGRMGAETRAEAEDVSGLTWTGKAARRQPEKNRRTTHQPHGPGRPCGTRPPSGRSGAEPKGDTHARCVRFRRVRATRGRLSANKVNTDTRNHAIWLHHGNGHPVEQHYEMQNWCLTDLGTQAKCLDRAHRLGCPVEEASYSAGKGASSSRLPVRATTGRGGGGPISISNIMNSEVRSNLQVQWVKLSVGHWRTAANPLLCISVAYPQASSCLLFCDRKVPMVL